MRIAHWIPKATNTLYIYYLSLLTATMVARKLLNLTLYFFFISQIVAICPKTFSNSTDR